MAYTFEGLSAEEMVAVRADVKKTLERTMYFEALRLGENPDTFDYASVTVPDGPENDPTREAKKAIVEAYATLQWLNSLS